MNFSDLEQAKFVLSVVGGVYLLFCFYRILKYIYYLLVTFGFKSYVEFKKYGSWAVVTGGTNGIGKALAHQLAAKGVNLIIISRDNSKLKQTAAELERKYNVETKTLQVDFKDSCKEQYDNISKFLSKFSDIGILINNVGMMHSLDMFTEIDDLSTACHDMVNVNILAQLRMTQILLPVMKKNKKGLILNISSISSFRPVPYMSIYGATKSFLNYFSQAIELENKTSGVEIMSIKPSFVITNMTFNKNGGFFFVSSEHFAKSALATVGKKITATFGCFVHELHANLVFRFATNKMLLSRMKTASDNWKKYAKNKNN